MGALQRHDHKVVTLDGTLTGTARRDREILLLVTSLGMVLSGVSLAGVLGTPRLMHLVGILINMAAVAVPFTRILMSMTVTKGLMRCIITALVFGVTLSDLSNRARYSHAWPIFVLLIDISLVLRLGRTFAVAMVSWVVFWLLLTQAEASLRFGLFDLPGSPPQSMRQELLSGMSRCGALPCPAKLGLSIADGVTAVAVFVGDFIATRGFADRVEKEQKAMQSTIDAVQRVATSLSQYDIDTVASLLEAEGHSLPEGMFDALRTLEHNLRVYRLYLPEALFDEMHRAMKEQSGLPEEGVPMRAAPPVTAEQEATLVFTDIRQSTSLWEAVPDAMKRALSLHNQTIREAIQRFSGYEVKTIGDSFMVAFEKLQEGVNFGLAVQAALYDADWPHSLLQVPLCSRDDLWAGLTVRIGVNHGAVSVEENALTHRFDYFGHTVNVAARLESICTPGAVAVMGCLWESPLGAGGDALWHSCLACVGSTVMRSLKGIRGERAVRLLWPESLAGRQRCPLDARTLCQDMGDGALTSPISSFNDTLSVSDQLSDVALRCVLPSVYRAPLRQEEATVGAVRLSTGGNPDAVGFVLSENLQVLTHNLERAHGTVVALVGDSVLVGWNLSRPLDCHLENSFKFVRLLQQVLGMDVVAVGLACGTVQHGDIGSNSQRFMTVVGGPVRLCWSLCDLAVAHKRSCLFVRDTAEYSGNDKAEYESVWTGLVDSGLAGEPSAPIHSRIFELCGQDSTASDTR